MRPEIVAAQMNMIPGIFVHRIAKKMPLMQRKPAGMQIS
jgi:hypothetical protein